VSPWLAHQVPSRQV